jgi:hypothetical protein
MGGECHYGNVVECLYAGLLLPSGDFTISEDEWNSLMLALYLDILRRSTEGDGFWTSKYNQTGHTGLYPPFHTYEYFHREKYDTPFWNGDTSGKNAYTGNICFENGKCHNRNDVNYVAQGMWSAAAHEGQLGGLVAANAWKWNQYKKLASPNVMYWTMRGVITYQQYTWP